MNKPSEHNYEVAEQCDTCGNEQMGTMHHAADAMGIATPVLWICHRCENPPIIVGKYRAIKRRIFRLYNKARYYATTTPAQRKARAEQMALARERIANRRKVNAMLDSAWDNARSQS